MEAIEKRYGGNKESKKVQRTLLKQQYENFAASSSKNLDQTFDRLQELISQLEVQGEVIKQEDINLKLLRSLPFEWKTHALIWRNKAEIETISLDDLYNNLKIYELELTGSSSTSQNPQNVAFVSSNSTNGINEADNTAYGVGTAYIQGNVVNSTSIDNLSDAVICAFLASQPNSPQLAREDLEQIDPDDLEEIDLKWEMAMLTIRARRFIKRTEKERDELKVTLEKYQNLSKSLNTLLKSQENVRSKSEKGYHAVPSPYKGNYIPPKPDLMFIYEQVESEYVDAVFTVSSTTIKTVESKVESINVKNKGVCGTVETKPVKKNSFSPPIIKDWNSDDESEVEFEPKVKDKNVRPSI
nr:hypothetical protein [Tanacetum cinerariifolium]